MNSIEEVTKQDKNLFQLQFRLKAKQLDWQSASKVKSPDYLLDSFLNCSYYCISELISFNLVCRSAFLSVK